MSTIEERIVTAVNDVEYGADIVEKFVDSDQLTDISTRKGPVKSLAQLTSTVSATKTQAESSMATHVAEVEVSKDSANQAILDAKTQAESSMSDHVAALKMLVDGKLSFLTKAAMEAFSVTGNPEAWVWNDPVKLNNGLYGWDGSAWIPSSLDFAADVYAELSSVLYTAPALASARALEGGLIDFVAGLSEEVTPAIVSDETDQVLLGFDKFGRAALDLAPSSLAVVASAIQSDNSLGYVEPVSHSDDLAFVLVDDSPRAQIVASCDNSGVWNFSGQKNDYGINLLNRPILYHIIQDGQSQSTGHSTKPPLTTTQTRGNSPLMQVGGLTTTTEDNFSSLVPLIETIGESPAAGMAQGLMEALEVLGVDVEAARFRIAFSNPGVGGTKIEQYVTGGNHYHRFYSQITWMQKAADQTDLDYQLHAFTWTLGGTDMGAGTSYDDFLSMLLQLRSEREIEARRILRRPSIELHSILWQNGARTWVENQNSTSQPMKLDIPNAQVAAAKQDARSHLACPSYMFDYIDAVHLTNVGSKLLGHYLQRVYRTVIIEEKEWAPLWPTKITENDRVIKLELNVPVPPLQFDTERLKSISDQGFMVADDDGVLVITGINIANGVDVEISVDRDLGVNPRLSYAENFTGSGTAYTGDQPRGLLRDSAGYMEKYMEPSLGLIIPMHNWCIAFNEAIVGV